MSAHDHVHSHDRGHGHDAPAHITRKGYVIGFVLSVILTAIPFWLVMTGALGSASATAFTIMGFAAVQIVVHMIYFLHMNSRAEGGWSMMAMVFTIVLLVIVLAGSLWVMHNMNANMMPSMEASDTSGM